MCELPLDVERSYMSPVQGLDDQLRKEDQSKRAEMTVTKQNAPAATEAGFETRPKPNYKRLPPYGKQLLAIREAGKVPIRTVMVCFDWEQARAYPRIIIPADMSSEKLDFRYLAGLPVQIIYRNTDAPRVNAIVQEIMQVNPSFLVTHGLDLVGTGDAWTIIKPQQIAALAGNT